MKSSERQAEVFRAFFKDSLREQGLRFSRDGILREIGRHEKEFNARHKLSRPLGKVEFLEMYLELMKELASEYFAMVEAKVAEMVGAKQTEMTDFAGTRQDDNPPECRM